MQFPLVIELRRSLLFLSLVVLAHIVSASAILGLSWPWFFRVPLVVIVLLSGAKFLLHPRRIARLVLSTKKDLQCEWVDGVRLGAQVLPDTTVFNQLIVLRLLVGDAHKLANLVLLPDQMTVAQYRALRVWLRWQAANGDVSQASS